MFWVRLPPEGSSFTADFETDWCKFCLKMPEMSDLGYIGKTWLLSMESISNDTNTVCPRELTGPVQSTMTGIIKCSQINMSWNTMHLSTWRFPYPKRILYSAIKLVAKCERSLEDPHHTKFSTTVSRTPKCERKRNLSSNTRFAFILSVEFSLK